MSWFCRLATFALAALAISGFTLSNSRCVQAGTLYVAINGSVSTSGVVRSYDTATGALLDANFITGPTWGYSMVGDASGNFYISTFTNSGFINQYDSDGDFVRTVVSNLTIPTGMAVDDANNRIYVGEIGFSAGSDRVGVYTLTGSTVNANLITGITDPRRLLLDGAGGLFVLDANNDNLSKYSTATANTKVPGFTESTRGSLAMSYQTSGTLVSTNAGGTNVLGKINPTTGAVVATGASGVIGSAMAIDEFGNIYVVNPSSDTIQKYDASGILLNASFITGLPGKSNGMVYVVPEPSTCVMALAGIACGGYSMWRRRTRA